MKALFWTTETNDCTNHVRAWNSFSPVPAAHIAFNHRGLRNDEPALEMARNLRPDVIFYIGACKAPGNPKPSSFIGMRRYGKLVNLCSDAMDKPWHPVLAAYRTQGCFDLQVSIDGARNAPVDMATLTPVDPGPFEAQSPARDIRCGFSGTVGRWNPRSEIVTALRLFGGLTVRDRTKADESYQEHAHFMKRCRMTMNFSHTGSGMAHHVKGRVLESGWAGCALLESEGSTIGEWLPPDCYLTYGDPREAARLITGLGDAQLDLMANRLSEEVRARFSPRAIYGEILERIGLVCPAVAVPALEPEAPLVGLGAIPEPGLAPA